MSIASHEHLCHVQVDYYMAKATSDADALVKLRRALAADRDQVASPGWHDSRTSVETHVDTELAQQLASVQIDLEESDRRQLALWEVVRKFQSRGSLAQNLVEALQSRVAELTEQVRLSAARSVSPVERSVQTREAMCGLDMVETRSSVSSLHQTPDASPLTALDIKRWTTEHQEGWSTRYNAMFGAPSSTCSEMMSPQMRSSEQSTSPRKFMDDAEEHKNHQASVFTAARDTAESPCFGDVQTENVTVHKLREVHQHEHNTLSKTLKVAQKELKVARRASDLILEASNQKLSETRRQLLTSELELIRAKQRVKELERTSEHGLDVSIIPGLDVDFNQTLATVRAQREALQPIADSLERSAPIEGGIKAALQGVIELFKHPSQEQLSFRCSRETRIACAKDLIAEKRPLDEFSINMSHEIVEDSLEHISSSTKMQELQERLKALCLQLQ